jgi:hypothetical protein
VDARKTLGLLRVDRAFRSQDCIDTGRGSSPEHCAQVPGFSMSSAMRMSGLRPRTRSSVVLRVNTAIRPGATTVGPLSRRRASVTTGRQGVNRQRHERDLAPYRPDIATVQTLTLDNDSLRIAWRRCA